MPDNHAFFVRGDDGEEYGPVELAELRDWARENRVGLGTTVRLDAPGELWQAWQYYPELVALLAETQVTGSPAWVGPILAPVGRRVLAGIVDLILNLALVVPLLVALYSLLPVQLIVQLTQFYQFVLQGMTPQTPSPPVPLWFEVLGNAIFLGMGTLYYTGFVAAHGRTPAKSLLRLQVVDAQGRKPAFLKALLRALVFVASVYIFYGIPLIFAFLNPQRRGLHDMVAGTYVVEL